MANATKYHKTVITNAIVVAGYWANDYQRIVDDAIERALSIVTGQTGKLVSLSSVSYVTIPIGEKVYLAVTIIAEAD